MNNNLVAPGRGAEIAFADAVRRPFNVPFARRRNGRVDDVAARFDSRSTEVGNDRSPRTEHALSAGTTLAHKTHELQKVAQCQRTRGRHESRHNLPSR